MDIESLRYFLAVAAAGSVSKAATRLGITQPALSRQVQRLEREFGTPFFYRNGRGVDLTQAGQTFFGVANGMLAQFESARAEIGEQSGRPHGTVILGVPPSFGGTLAAPVALRFRKENPQASLRVREAFSSTLLEWVEAGRIDLAVLYDARRGRNQIVSELLREDLFLVQSSRCPVASSKVTAVELARQLLVLPSSENGLRRVVDEAVHRCDAALHVDMEIDSVSALKQLVESGRWSTILPFGAVHAEVSEGRLIARPLAMKTQALLVTATPTNRPVSRAATALLRIVRSEVSSALERGLLRGVATDPD